MEGKKLCKAFSWMIFLGLCGLSAFLMYEVLEQFFSGDTSFKVTQEPITDYPTITICFTKTKEVWEDLLSSENKYANVLGEGLFKYGDDFNISIGNSLLGQGDNYLIDTKESVTVKSIGTFFRGTCYIVTQKYSRANSKPISDVWTLHNI